MDTFLENIYDILDRKTKEIKELKSQQKLQVKINPVKNLNHIELCKPGRYPHPIIYNEITKSKNYDKETHYRLSLNTSSNEDYNELSHINIYLHGSVNTKTRVSKNIENALICLMMLYELSKTCNTRHYFKEIHIYLFLTPFTKTLPKESFNHQITTPLGSFHINSGVTRHNSYNGEILIYREEEWFKLLLHESIHLLGFDRHLIENSINNITLMQYFHINQDIKHNEGYTELMAQILQCVYISYKKGKSVVQRKKKWSKCIELEKKHSILQIKKLLKYMKIEPIEFLTNTNTFINNYKEETNIFSYYIIKTILLYNLPSLFSSIIPYDLCITKDKTYLLPSFIIRCFENKTNNLFRKHILNLRSFSKKKTKKKSSKNKSKKKTHKYSSKSLRMAYHDVIDL